MKKTLAFKLLCTTIATSSLIVAIPLINTSCSKTVALKAIPITFYNVSGTDISGWSDEALANPDSLKEYNFMSFDSTYTFVGETFYSSDAEKESAIEACFQRVVKMDLSNINSFSEAFLRLNLSHLKGTAGLKGTAIILPLSLGEFSFMRANLSGITMLDLSGGIAVGANTFSYADLSGIRKDNLILKSDLDWNTFSYAIIPNLKQLNLTNVTLGESSFSRVNFSGLEKINLTNATLGDFSFMYEKLLSLKTIIFSTTSHPNNNFFTGSEFTLTTSNRIALHLPSTTTTSEWDSWATTSFGAGCYQYFLDQ